MTNAYVQDGGGTIDTRRLQYHRRPGIAARRVSSTDCGWRPGLGKPLRFRANGYNGGTTVNGGTLQLGNVSALGTGALAANNGTLDLHGFGVTVHKFQRAQRNCDQ